MIRGSEPVSQAIGAPSSLPLPPLLSPVTQVCNANPSLHFQWRLSCSYALRTHTLTQHSHVAQQRKPASSSSFGTLTREETTQLTKKSTHHNTTTQSRWGPPNEKNPLGCGWGDYVPCNTTHEGHVDLSKTWEARGEEKDSKYRPRVADLAPRPAGWKSSATNTQMPPINK